MNNITSGGNLKLYRSHVLISKEILDFILICK